MQMAFEYQNSKKQTVAALHNIQAMTQNGLSQALWEFNSTQIEAILQGMYTNQFIVGLQLEIAKNNVVPDLTQKEIGLVADKEGKSVFVDPKTYAYSAPKSIFENLIPYSFDIKHIDSMQNEQTIGQMNLYSSNKIVFDQVKENYILLVINAIIKTAALWIIALWAGYRYISRPLKQLDSATKKLSAGNWNIELAYKKSSKNNKTEINTLFDSFNEMTHKLYSTQDKLETSRNRLNNIFDAMPSALISIDQNCNIVAWNKDTEQATGISNESALGQSLLVAYPAFTDYMYLIETAKKLQSVQLIKNAKLNTNTQGDNRLYNLAVYPILVSEQYEAVIRIDDVTEAVKQEADLAQIEKLASAGALIAGVAHEINNPLGTIMQSTQTVLRRIDPNLAANQEVASKLGIDLELQSKYLEQREITTFLNGIHSAGERASSIVKNMLKFTRRSTTNMLKADLIELINDGLQLASTDVTLQEKTNFKKISIIKDSYADVVLIECMPMEIQQVILNLIKNAAQALEDTIDNKQISITISKLNQDKVKLTITDNGSGIPADILDKVFQPFFTTKPIGQGTGLGLSVCRNIIVQKHHGDMVVESAINVGTKFTITLPFIQRAEHNVDNK